MLRLKHSSLRIRQQGLKVISARLFMISPSVVNHRFPYLIIIYFGVLKFVIRNPIHNDNMEYRSFLSINYVPREIPRKIRFLYDRFLWFINWYDAAVFVVRRLSLFVNLAFWVA